MATDRAQPLLEVKQVGEDIIATLTQPVMLNEEEIDCIGEDLCALAMAPSRRLVVNFAPVTRMSTHMLGALIVLHKRVRTIGGRLALCGLNPNIRETFDALRLTSLFSVHDTEEDAVAAPGPK